MKKNKEKAIIKWIIDEKEYIETNYIAIFGRDFKELSITDNEKTCIIYIEIINGVLERLHDEDIKEFLKRVFSIKYRPHPDNFVRSEFKNIEFNKVEEGENGHFDSYNIDKQKYLNTQIVNLLGKEYYQFKNTDFKDARTLYAENINGKIELIKDFEILFALNIMYSRLVNESGERI